MTVAPNELINNWVKNNARDCEIIAIAALYAIFVETDPDTGDERLNFQKDYDVIGIHNEVVEAIRSTNFARSNEACFQFSPRNYWS